MENSNPNKTPLSNNVLEGEIQEDSSITYPIREAVGCLNYLAGATRPDIQQAVSLCAKHVSKPSEALVTAIKGIFRYLNGTIEAGLCYHRDNTYPIFAACDSNLADPRSRTGYTIWRGGAMICGESRLQNTVALSSCEAEYYSAVEC